MSKLNKIIANLPVSLTTEENEALSQTFSAVTAAGGGGGGQGIRYAGDGVTIVLNTTQNTFSLHQDYINAVQGIPTKVTDLTDSANYELASHASSTYLTKASADNDYGAKVDVTALKNASAGWDKGAALTAYSANGKWLIADDITGKQNTLQFGYDSDNYIVSINSSAIAQPDVSNFLTKASADTDYQPKGDYQPAGAYATSSTIAGDSVYGLTTAGWQPVEGGGGGGGGMIAVTHDDTLSGDGTDAAHKLGVAWSALSAGTINSALSAGSAAKAALLGTSSLADITGAINLKADATAISDMLTKTLAASTYQTTSGMTAYQTTAGMSDYWKKTETSSDAQISAALTAKQDALTFNYADAGHTQISGINGYDFVIPSLPHITVIPGPYLSASEGTGTDGGKWTVGVTDVGKSYLDAVPNKVNKPTVADTNFIYTTSGGTSGWTDADAIYATTAAVDAKLNKVDISITGADNVLRIKEAANTSATFSAVSWYANTAVNAFKAQKIFVVRNDDDIMAHAQYANNQGCLFFVVSGHS